MRGCPARGPGAGASGTRNAPRPGRRPTPPSRTGRTPSTRTRRPSPPTTPSSERGRGHGATSLGTSLASTVGTQVTTTGQVDQTPVLAGRLSCLSSGGAPVVERVAAVVTVHVHVVAEAHAFLLIGTPRWV